MLLTLNPVLSKSNAFKISTKLINVFKMAAHLDAKYAIEMIFDTSSTKMRLKLTLKRK